MDDADVRRAVDDLVLAFSQGRLEDYFACFDPACTFVFWSSRERLDSVQAYRELWARWEAKDGFVVLGCETSGTNVQRFGEVAVVTHEVRTRVRVGGQEQDLRERETIVLLHRDGRWVGVHEHLSPMPA